MNKIIYVLVYPSTPQIEKYMYIRDVIQAGLKVEYWDLSGFYFKDFPFQDVISADYIKKINSLRELKSCLAIENLEKTVFVLQVFYEWKYLSLYAIFSWFRCKTVYFPIVDYLPKPLISKIVGKLKSPPSWEDLVRIFLNLVAKFFKKVGLIKKYNLLFVSGQLTADSYRQQGKLVNINYIDYERFLLSQKSKERIVSEDYCVFLDQGFIHNEDSKILNLEKVDAEEYFSLINKSFDILEKRFDVKVVVAAHPGIHYDKKIFQGRDSYSGKTCDLVKDCKFVIAQASMAVSFAILYEKPIIFICTDEFIEKREGNFKAMEYRASQLGLKILNISSPRFFDELEISNVNLSLYKKYKYTNFTSKESEGRISKEIVIENLMRL